MSAVTDIGKFQEAYTQGRIKLVVQAPGTYASQHSGGNKNKVVVYGHPEFSQEEARAVYDYVKKNPGNHDITKKGNTITIKTSSEDYIRKALKLNDEIMKEEEQRLNTPPVYDNSGAGSLVTPNSARPSSFLPAPPSAPEETIRKPITINTSGVMSVKQANVLQTGTPTKQEQFLRDFNLQRTELKQKLFTVADTEPVNLPSVGSKLIVPGVVLAGTGIIKGGVSAGKDIVTLQIIPNTTNFLTETVSNPRGVIRNVKTEFGKNPLGFTGEQVGYGFVTGKVVGGVSRPGKVIKGAKNIYTKYENVLIRSVEPNYPYADIPEFKYSPPKKDYVVVRSQELLAEDKVYFSQGRGIQTNLKGGLVSDAELQRIGMQVKKSPLGLDETPFYNEPVSKQRISLLISKEGELKARSSIIESNNVFDDVINIPEVKVPLSGEVIIKSGDVLFKQKVEVEKVFPERKIGETTKTDFFERSNPSVKPEEFKVEVKEFDVSKQKTLSDEKGNLLYAQIVPSPIFEIGKIVYDEFKPKFYLKDVAKESAFSGVNKKVYSNKVFIPKYNPDVAVKLSPVIINAQRFSPESNVLQISKPDILSEVNLNIRSKPVSMQESNIITKQAQRSASGLKYDLKYENLTENVLLKEQIRTPLRENVRKIYTPSRRKVPKIKPEVPLFKLEKKKESFGKPFRVEVKKKKKFLEVGEFSTSEKAFEFGRLLVSNTASASLRVRNVESGGFEKNKSVLSNKQFYQSNKDKGVYVERRGQRIKSPGEKQEITFRGLEALRGKRLFK